MQPLLVLEGALCFLLVLNRDIELHFETWHLGPCLRTKNKKIVLVSSNTIIVFTFLDSLSPFLRRAIWLAYAFNPYINGVNGDCKDGATCCTLDEYNDGCQPSFFNPNPGELWVECLLDCDECYDDAYGKVSHPTYDAHPVNILNHQKCPDKVGDMLRWRFSGLWRNECWTHRWTRYAFWIFLSILCHHDLTSPCAHFLCLTSPHRCGDHHFFHFCMWNLPGVLLSKTRSTRRATSTRIYHSRRDPERKWWWIVRGTLG